MSSKQTKKPAPQRNPAPKGPIAAGEIVKWTHGSGGGSLKRRGKVLAHVPKGETIRAALVALERSVENYGHHAQRSAVYLVEVDGHLYTPYAGTIERANPRAKRMPAS